MAVSNEELGRLLIRISVDLADMKRGFEQAKSATKDAADGIKGELGKIDEFFSSMKTKVAGVVAGVVSITAAYKGLKDSVASTAQLGTQTLQLQRITGMTAQDASTMIAVSGKMGVSFESLAAAVVSVTRRMGTLKDLESMTVDETGKSVDVFKKFGIEVKNVDGTIRPFIEIFSQIREKIRNAGTSTEQLAIATQFFRYGARDLMPLLTMTDKQYQALAEDAKRYGLVLTSQNIAAVHAYTMAHRGLDETLTGLKVTIGQAIIPLLTEQTKALTELIPRVRDFAKEWSFIFTLPWQIMREIKDNLFLLLAAITPLVAVVLVPIVQGWITALSGFSLGLAATTIQVQALSVALAVLLGYKIGEFLDQLIYRLARIDISGLNRLRETEQATAEGMEFLAKRAEETSKKLAGYGFVGPQAMEQFKNAVRAGIMVWDASINDWKRIQGEIQPSPAQIAAFDKLKEKLREVHDELIKLEDPEAAAAMKMEQFIVKTLEAAGIIDESKIPAKMKAVIADLRASFATLQVETEWKKVEQAQSKAFDEMTEKTIEYSMELLKLKDPIAADREELDLIIAKMIEGKQIMTGNTQAMDTLLESAIALRAAYNALKDAQREKAIAEAEAQAAEIRYSESTKTVLDNLKRSYDQGLLSATEYYAAVRKTAQETTDFEVDQLQAKIDLPSTKEEERIKLLAQIDAKKWELIRKNSEIDAQDLADQKKVADEKIRLMEMTAQEEMKVLQIRAKRYEISPTELAKGEIDILEREKKGLQDFAMGLDLIKDKNAFLAVQKQIQGVNEKLVDANLRLHELTGSFGEGLAAGIKQTGWEITNFKVGFDMAKQGISAFGDAFKNFLIKGKLDWKSFADAMNNIWAGALSKMAEKFLTDFLMKIMGGSSGGGGSFLSWLGGLFGLGGSHIIPSASEAAGGAGIATGPGGEMPMQSGGQFWAERPTRILVGEAFRRELVSVVPESMLRSAPLPKLPTAAASFGQSSSLTIGPISIDTGNRMKDAVMRGDLEDVLRKFVKDHS